MPKNKNNVRLVVWIFLMVVLLIAFLAILGSILQNMKDQQSQITRVVIGTHEPILVPLDGNSMSSNELAGRGFVLIKSNSAVAVEKKTNTEVEVLYRIKPVMDNK